MATPDPKNPSPAPSGSADRWILLVDDEPAMRQLIETVLDTQNWVVRVADGAAAAMAIVNATPAPRR